MQPHIRINMLFKDRIEIVADISRLINKRNLNIYSMEVAIHEDNADISIEEASGNSHFPKIFQPIG